MYKQNTCKNMKKDREEKTKFSEILQNNQIITACHIKLYDYEEKINYDWPKNALIYIKLDSNSGHK